MTEAPRLTLPGPDRLAASLPQTGAPARLRAEELRTLTQALNGPGTVTTLAALEALCERLAHRADASGPSPTARATGTAPDQATVDDYDRYFAVHHVRPRDQAVCLIDALAVSARAFFRLCARMPERFPNTAVERQRQGFLACARLLTRVLELPASG